MSALVALPTAAQLLAAADFDEVLAVVCELVASEADLSKLHTFVTHVDAQAEVLRRLRGEIDDATRASMALDRVAAWASLCLGERLGELDGGGPGKPPSKRSEACKEIGLGLELGRRLVRLAELGAARTLELVDGLEAAGKRPTPWAIVEASKDDAGEVRDSDECYTPARHIGAVVEVFGQRPDEDIASCPVAQLTVQALRWWSKAEPARGPAEIAAGITEAVLGLMRERWGGPGELYDADGVIVEPDEDIADLKKRRQSFARKANAARLVHAEQLQGKVWGNPPYSFPGPFVLAIVEGYLGRPLAEVVGELEGEAKRAALRSAAAEAAGLVTESILLLNVAPGTAAQQLALAVSSAQCWVEGRINFNDATGQPLGGSNRFEQVFFYFGPTPERFAEVFRKFGAITFSRKS